MRLTLFPALLLLALAQPATAQTLTTEKADDFLESLPAVEEYVETLDAEARAGAFNDNLLPEAGTPFAPYSTAMDYLEQNHGETYNMLNDIVADFAFSSPREWAGIGDRVMTAYMAIEMEGTDMGEITPEMLEQVPPQMRPQIERMLALMETVRNASPEDVEAVRPLTGKLEEYIGEIGGQGVQ